MGKGLGELALTPDDRNSVPVFFAPGETQANEILLGAPEARCWFWVADEAEAFTDWRRDTDVGVERSRRRMLPRIMGRVRAMATFHQVRRPVGSREMLARRRKALVSALVTVIVLALGLIYWWTS